MQHPAALVLRTGTLIQTSIPISAGADIALTYTSRDATEIAAALARDHNVKAHAFKCDVADSSQVAKAIEDVEKHFGKKVDIGIANAGELAHARKLVTYPSLACSQALLCGRAQSAIQTKTSTECLQ